MGFLFFSFWHWAGWGDSKQNTNIWHDMGMPSYFSMTVSEHIDQLSTLQHYDLIQEYSFVSSLLWFGSEIQSQSKLYIWKKEQNIVSSLLQKWWYYLLILKVIGKIKRSRSSKTDLQVVFFSTISNFVLFIYVLVLRPLHQMVQADGSYNGHPENVCNFLKREQFRYLWWISAAALFGFS